MPAFAGMTPEIGHDTGNIVVAASHHPPSAFGGKKTSNSYRESIFMPHIWS